MTIMRNTAEMPIQICQNVADAFTGILSGTWYDLNVGNPIDAVGGNVVLASANYNYPNGMVGHKLSVASAPDTCVLANSFDSLANGRYIYKAVIGQGTTTVGRFYIITIKGQAATFDLTNGEYVQKVNIDRTVQFQSCKRIYNPDGTWSGLFEIAIGFDVVDDDFGSVFALQGIIRNISLDTAVMDFTAGDNVYLVEESLAFVPGMQYLPYPSNLTGSITKGQVVSTNAAKNRSVKPSSFTNYEVQYEFNSLLPDEIADLEAFISDINGVTDLFIVFDSILRVIRFVNLSTSTYTTEDTGYDERKTVLSCLEQN